MKILTPLAGDTSRKTDKIATFDIESHDWKKYAYGAHYNGLEVRYFEGMKDLLDFMLQDKFRDWKQFAHYGGRFDFLFLLDAIQHTGLKFKPLAIGAKLAELKIEKPNNRGHYWYFRDSSTQLGDSLARLTQSFGVTEKLQGAIDFDAGERFDFRNSLHREYLRRDVVGLYEVIKAYQSHEAVQAGGLKLTIASQGMDFFRRGMKEPLIQSPDSVQNFVRESYVGGRCELFKFSGDQISVYDINSMYPYVMRHKTLPMEYIGQSSDWREFGFHKCRIKMPETYIPPLPSKISGKLYFPIGNFEGTYFSEELKLASSLGAEIELIEGHQFSQSDHFFKNYIDYWWNERQKHPSGTARNYIAKLFMNSLYGKFGQKEEMIKTISVSELKNQNFEPFINEEISEKLGLVNLRKRHRSPFMLVHLAAAITSWSRIHLYRYILHNEKSVYYCDTDSLFTSHRYPSGIHLGDLKIEYDKVRFEGRGAKHYMIETDTDKIMKAKGFPKKFIKTLSEAEFLRGAMNYSEEKLLTFKRALISNGEILSTGQIRKSVRNEYLKRKRLPNGETAPWKIYNNRLI